MCRLRTVLLIGLMLIYNFTFLKICAIAPSLPYRPLCPEQQYINHLNCQLVQPPPLYSHNCFFCIDWIFMIDLVFDTCVQVLSLTKMTPVYGNIKYRTIRSR